MTNLNSNMSLNLNKIRPYQVHQIFKEANSLHLNDKSVIFDPRYAWETLTIEQQSDGIVDDGDLPRVLRLVDYCIKRLFG